MSWSWPIIDMASGVENLKNGRTECVEWVINLPSNRTATSVRAASEILMEGT